VLIVCEGAKSEPNYFNRLRNVYRLSSANVRITPAGGSDPMSIVSFAEDELARAGYDRAYCVFDRDGHANYPQAIQKISQSQLGRANRLVAVPSIPCFEVWVLLHFIYSTSPFTAVGTVSACDSVVREVRKYIPNYAKGFLTLFETIEANIDQAITHARRLEAYNTASGSTNPATHIHVLVDYLRSLRAS
jgi:RloB-like protein